MTTFNTIESVALLTLCPSEQKLLPSSVRSKIHGLGKSTRRTARLIAAGRLGLTMWQSPLHTRSRERQ